MRKLVLLLTLLSSVAFAADQLPPPESQATAGYRVAKKASCTTTQYQADLAKFVVVKDLTTGTMNPAAVIDPLVNGEFASQVAIAYNSVVYAPTKMTDAQYSTIASKSKAFRAAVVAAAPCLITDGFTGGYKFTLSMPSSNGDTNLQYSTFESQNPLIGNPGRIFMVDSIMSQSGIPAGTSQQYDMGADFVTDNGYAVNSSFSDVYHGNRLGFIATNYANPGVHITPEAVGVDIGVRKESVAPAIDWAVARAASGKSVINLSFASIYGNDSTIREATAKAAAAGVPVVQSLQNDHVPNLEDAVYDRNVITVGTIKGTELLSNYGKNGPDIVLDLTGFAPMLGTDGVIRNVPYTTYGASGAAMQVSAAITRMQSVCPTAKPSDIKKALIDTAYLVPVTNTPATTWGPAVTSAKRANLNRSIEYLLVKRCPERISSAEKPGAWTQWEWNTWMWNIQTAGLDGRFKRLSYIEGCVDRGRPVNQYTQYTEMCGTSTNPTFMPGYTTFFRGQQYWSTYSNGLLK